MSKPRPISRSMSSARSADAAPRSADRRRAPAGDPVHLHERQGLEAARREHEGLAGADIAAMGGEIADRLVLRTGITAVSIAMVSRCENPSSSGAASLTRRARAQLVGPRSKLRPGRTRSTGIGSQVPSSSATVSPREIWMTGFSGSARAPAAVPVAMPLGAAGDSCHRLRHSRAAPAPRMPRGRSRLAAPG